jgi:hypothetical protein
MGNNGALVVALVGIVLIVFLVVFGASVGCAAWMFAR